MHGCTDDPVETHARLMPASVGWSLGLLLLLAASLHAWLIATTAVTARDSIGYIRYARKLEAEPSRTSLRAIEQHPLYPVSLLAISYPVRWLQGGVTPQGMVLSGQLATALAGILLVVPMFFLGRELFSPRVGFWAAALFQLLPVCAQVTSDALSDGLFLLLLTSGLVFGVQALHRKAPWRFVPCGLLLGLAYLTRPEGALACVLFLLALLGCQCFPTLRWSWTKLSLGATALTVSAALVAVPYMAAIGGVTVKPTAGVLLNQLEYDLVEPEQSRSALDREPSPVACADAAPLAVILGVWWVDQQKSGMPPLWWSLKVLVVETIHAFHYIAWVPALLGLWWFRDRWRTMPGMWVVLSLSLVLALILWRVVHRVGYLSERHTLVLVLCGSFWAAAALVRIADGLPGWFEHRWRRPIPARFHGAIGLTWLVVLTAWCLPSTLKPLHANRAGFRAAGEWLAVNTEPAAPIIDPFCWTHYYAGRVFQEAEPAGRVNAVQRYVVVTVSKNSHNRLTTLAAARELAQQGTLVFRWTPSPAQLKRYRAEEVQVYAVPPSARQLQP